MVTNEQLAAALAIAEKAKHVVISLNPDKPWTRKIAKMYLILDDDCFCDKCNQYMSSKQALKNHYPKCGQRIFETIIKCPYCDVEGASHIMKRWHFDNCKLK